eukprot:jgi/Hompol1/4255/HPOL_003553-RA
MVINGVMMPMVKDTQSIPEVMQKATIGRHRSEQVPLSLYDIAELRNIVVGLALDQADDVATQVCKNAAHEALSQVSTARMASASLDIARTTSRPNQHD